MVDFNIRESLKRLLYIGKIDEFRNNFEQIYEQSRSQSDGIAEQYMIGKDDEYRGLLSWAAKQSTCTDILEYLVNRGANIDQLDNKGDTPLMSSVNTNCPSNAQKLLALKANPCLVDCNGDTILHMATKNYNFYTKQFMKLFFDNKLQFQTDNYGATPLHIAATHDLKGLKVIVDCYDEDIVDVINKQDSDGDTALHYVATDYYNHDRDANIEYLLSIGADGNIVNSNGETYQDTII